jgi:hypothetical protein
MEAAISKSPVEDTVPKVNDEIAVGEDPDFQRRWWKFESAVFIIFTILVVLDLLGAFGRGPLAKAHEATPDGAMNVTYERIERTGTPSVLKVEFGNSAIKANTIQLWANENLVTKLGNKQIAPQPAKSVIGDDGIHYTFDATKQPAATVFSLQPSAPGLYGLTLRVSGSSELHFSILVMP